MNNPKQYYTRVLVAFGITEHDGWVGFGKNSKPEFCFGPGKDTKGIRVLLSLIQMAII